MMRDAGPAIKVIVKKRNTQLGVHQPHKQKTKNQKNNQKKTKNKKTKNNKTKQKQTNKLKTGSGDRNTFVLCALLKTVAISRASSRCCSWSCPTGTCVALHTRRKFWTQQSARHSMTPSACIFGCKPVEENIGRLEHRVGKQTQASVVVFLLPRLGFPLGHA
jgi:hypothetical protein